jgi:hypothetical protein
MEAYLRLLLASTLVEGQLSTSLPNRFITGEKASVPIEQGAGWASEMLWTLLGDKNQLLLPGTGSPIFQSVASSLYRLSYSGFYRQNNVSECNSNTTKKLLFAVNTTIEFKNATITLDNAVTLLIQYIPLKMQLL